MDIVYKCMCMYNYAPIKGSVEDMAPHSLVRVNGGSGQHEYLALKAWAAWRD